MLNRQIVKATYNSQINRLLRKNKQFQSTYFKKPQIEGEYGVLPPRIVPSHIPMPDYVNSQNPIYGKYEGAPVKHNEDMIKRLRVAAKVASNTAKLVSESVKEKMTTDDIDKIVHDSIIEQGAYPSPIGFMKFPKSVCTSVNEVCCHGIPNLRPLENGDTLNIDITCFIEGVHGDTSVMVQVGDVHPDIKRLIETTQKVKAVYEAIKVCKPGVRFSQIGDVIDEIAQNEGFVVCELFTGHGIGHLMHMPPTIIHHINDYPGKMEKGNIFTIEPILLLKHGQYAQWNDNFTVVSPQNPSAQWEHMVLITDNGYEVLTQREGEII